MSRTDINKNSANTLLPAVLPYGMVPSFSLLNFSNSLSASINATWHLFYLQLMAQAKVYLQRLTKRGGNILIFQPLVFNEIQMV
jgi:hypothetical protein